MCFCLCSCTGNVIRSIPWCSLVGFFLSFLGGALATSARQPLDASLSALKLESAASVLQLVWLAFALTVLVNAAAAFQAFTTSGKTRELLYSHTDSLLCGFLQFFVGITTQVSIFLLLVGTFVLQLVVAYGTAPGLVLLVVVRLACDTSEEALTSVLKVLTIITSQDSLFRHVTAAIPGAGPAVDIMDGVNGGIEAMTLCEEHSITSGLSKLIFGGTVVLLAQVLMLILAWGNLLKAWFAMRSDERKALVLGDASYQT